MKNTPKDTIKMQSQFCSDFDQNAICSLDIEVIEEPTKPLIHQMSRFLFVTKGSGMLRLQGQEYELRAGTLVSILPWQTTDVYEVNEPIQFYLLKYYYDSVNSIIKSFYNTGNDVINITSDLTKRPVINCDEEQLKSVDLLFSQIRKEIGIDSRITSNHEKDLSNIYLTNKIVELIIQFYRIGEENIGDSNEHHFTIDNAEILQYIYNHLSEKLTLTKLASLFFISETGISNYIHATTGLSFFDLLNEMRIGKTVNFLMYTDFTMEELAEILGFVDGSHISKVFMARIGMKANEYRKTYQKVNYICKVKETKASFEIIDYIYRHYMEALTPKLVADLYGVSVKNLNKILLYQVEKNYEDFVNYVRVNRASELLLSTSKTITDIAIEVGYNTSKTLTRNFLKFRLMTPGVFRKTVELQEGKL